MQVARVLLSASAVLVVSCGDSGLPPSPEGSAAPGAGVYATPPPPPTGRLTVTVTDPDGGRLPEASVTIYDQFSQPGPRPTTVSDQHGIATFEAVPARVNVCANHPFGYSCNSGLAVAQLGNTSTTLIVDPALPVTVAMLPVSVTSVSLSADRKSLDFRVDLVASPLTLFFPSSHTGPASVPVFLRLDNCSIQLGYPNNSPTCGYYDDDRRIEVLDYAHSSGWAPVLPPAQPPFAALVLLDQSQRAKSYDPYDLRMFAARQFIRRARTTPWPDLVAVAGFAGQGTTASSPAMLPQLPLWAPAGGPTVFSGETLAHASAVETLRPLIGGNAPVFEALRDAMTLTTANVPATHRRVIVAVLGGGDDSGLSETQRTVALASLRQQQSDTGTEVVLVASRLGEGAADRALVGELAAALRAPIIYSGPPNAHGSWSDGLYAALDLAADLLASSSMPHVKATFRMKSDQPEGFKPGTTLRATVWLESSPCSFGCSEAAYPIAVEIP